MACPSTSMVDYNVGVEKSLKNKTHKKMKNERPSRKGRETTTRCQEES
jgi:hypothetical protein